MMTPTINGLKSYFRVNGNEFEHKENGEWKQYNHFAGVNLGITEPGYQPGQVILDYEDYMIRFKYLDTLGSNIIRVYSLLQPDFYKALLDWNKDHEPIYVLHGTAFPEIAMEHNNGTSAFDEKITEKMEYYINTTVHGVYGGGLVTYRYDYSEDPPKAIVGDYDYDISEYILGWVISGEISPKCIDKTNKDTNNIYYNNGKYSYSGKYFSTKEHDNNKTRCLPRTTANGFETWVARMFDILAIEISKYGYSVPISHTNWVTTDGLCHPIEPRVGDIEYGSVEDWEEFDMHYIDDSKWEGGLYYNQHAYPYYPELVKINGNNSFMDYIIEINDYYSNRPLIITEIGLPTSVGVSSVDRYYDRNHGHNGEIQQGDMMSEMMIEMTEVIGINGVIVFQLYDEWFKKSWNTIDVDNKRQKWKNVLTSEQYFGIMNVESHPDYYKNKVKEENSFYSVEIKNNYEFVEIDITLNDINLLNNNEEIFIGIDMSPGGTNKVPILGTFENNIDAFITISNKGVQYLISSEYNTFKSHYGLWLQPETFPNFQETIMWNEFWNNNPSVRDLCYRNGCDSLNQYQDVVSFDDYKLLVKVPTIANFIDENCINETIKNINNFKVEGINKCEIRDNITYYEAQIYTVEFKEPKFLDDENLSLYNRDNNNIHIKIPYQMLGFSDPSKHLKYIPVGMGKQFNISEFKYNSGLTFEVYYSMGVQYEHSGLVIPFNWEEWNIPKYWMIRPKRSFNGFRNTFHLINFNKTVTNLTSEELESLIWYSKLPGEENLGFTLHYYLVKCSIIILIIALGCASFGKLFMIYAGYCYSAQKITIYNKQLISLNAIATCGLIYILLMIEPTVSYFSTSYIFYILLVVWDFLILVIVMLYTPWNLHEKNTRTFNSDDHAFVIACHNSSDVIESTLYSLLRTCKPRNIFVADNGSSKEESNKTKELCGKISKIYQEKHNGQGDNINYGFMTIGNKTIAQYGAVSNLPPEVKYVTCIDDDTRLDKTWNVHKVIKYFEDDEDIAVLAYPLTVWKPELDIEWFQAIEYLVVGYIKIFHSKIYSTIFNSGAFGTYRVELLREAFLYHNTDYHGDDLQICMNIHQLKGKKFYNHPNKIHTKNYKVATATDMIVSTITPKCWIHMSSLSKCFTNKCKCGNPDLFQQRCKGWFVSQHRFIPKYLKLILNIKGINKSLWVRFIALYELIVILNEYFAIFYMIFFLSRAGMWLIEGFLIGYAFNILVMTIFNWYILRNNDLYIPYEVITIQPLVYKIIMVTIYRYMGLLYNLFIYTIKHKSGKLIKKRLKEESFRHAIIQMYPDNATVISEDELKGMVISNSNSSFMSVAESENFQVITK